MKKIYLVPLVAISISILSSCVSSVEVINSWKSDQISTLIEQRILVIARTENNKSRGAFEEEIVKQLKSKGIKASTSYMKIPILNEERRYTDDEKKELVKHIKELGFNAIILTEVKQRSEQAQTIEEGGYYTGGSYSSLYPQYYGGFYGYYNHPYSHPTYQSYVPGTTSTEIIKSYVLETVFFNLDLSSTEQLVGVVTSAINDPENAYTAAEEYVKKIMKSLKK